MRWSSVYSNDRRSNAVVKGYGLRLSHIENGNLLPNLAGKIGGQAFNVIDGVEHDRILTMLSM